LGPCQCIACESHKTAAPRGILKIRRKIQVHREVSPPPPATRGGGGGRKGEKEKKIIMILIFISRKRRSWGKGEKENEKHMNIETE
jgi:hypothetical protein